MTESLSSLCRTLTPEGGYQLRDSVLARVEYIGRIGQGRAGTQGTGSGRDTRYTGCLSVRATRRRRRMQEEE